MEKRTFRTPQGDIAYWVSRKGSPNKPWLVFLPGLTADHRLFNPQIAAFESKANLLVWDAPSHGESRPFELAWTLDDLARWLHGILEREGIARPILVGQSLGGYIAQAYLDLFPGQAAGFISIDSAPLKRRYFHGWEIWALRHTHLMYLSIPWKTLVRLGSTGCATTPQGQTLMREMMAGYGKREYCDLAAHGYRALAYAAAEGRPYIIDCPSLLICGEKDAAGSARGYNKRWAAAENLDLHWIAAAGHNSNTDKPDEVNALIEEFWNRVR